MTVEEALTILSHDKTFSFKCTGVQRRVLRQPHGLCWGKGCTWIVVMFFSLNSARGCFRCRCSLTWIPIWIKPFLTQGWLSKNTWMSSLNIWWAAFFFPKYWLKLSFLELSWKSQLAYMITYPSFHNPWENALFFLVLCLLTDYSDSDTCF